MLSSDSPLSPRALHILLVAGIEAPLVHDERRELRRRDVQGAGAIPLARGGLIDLGGARRQSAKVTLSVLRVFARRPTQGGSARSDLRFREGCQRLLC